MSITRTAFTRGWSRLWCKWESCGNSRAWVELFRTHAMSHDNAVSQVSTHGEVLRRRFYLEKQQNQDQTPCAFSAKVASMTPIYCRLLGQVLKLDPGSADSLNNIKPPPLAAAILIQHSTNRGICCHVAYHAQTLSSLQGSTEPLKISGLPTVGTWPAGGLPPLDVSK